MTFLKLVLATTLTSALTLGAALGVAEARQVGTAADNVSEMQVADRGDDERVGKHRGGKHKRGGHHGEHRGHKMQMLDANGDGVIGDEEGAAMADNAFTRIDDDKDSKITEAEYLAAHARRGWGALNVEEVAAVQAVRKQKFASYDSNKDATLDKTEYFAAVKAKLAAADADKDGKVTPWEYRAAN